MADLTQRPSGDGFAGFMAIIPTFEVIIDPDHETLRRVFRVPQPHLESFIHGLLLSGCEDFRVIREEVMS